MSILAASYEVDPVPYNYYTRILRQIEKDEFGFYRKQEARLSTPRCTEDPAQEICFCKRLCPESQGGT